MSGELVTTTAKEEKYLGIKQMHPDHPSATDGITITQPLLDWINKTNLDERRPKPYGRLVLR